MLSCECCNWKRCGGLRRLVRPLSTTHTYTPLEVKLSLYSNTAKLNSASGQVLQIRISFLPVILWSLIFTKHHVFYVFILKPQYSFITGFLFIVFDWQFSKLDYIEPGICLCSFAVLQDWNNQAVLTFHYSAASSIWVMTFFFFFILWVLLPLSILSGSASSSSYCLFFFWLLCI